MASRSAYAQFLDDNVKGGANKALLGLSAVEIANSDNKLKALLKTLGQMILFRPLIAIGLAGAFGSMGKSIRSVLAETGSLQAALRKLAQIQGLQRMFAPLVGGAEAAKLKVAQLVNFAASNRLDLGDVGTAARSLEELTHGAYAGAGALELIGDTAAATGNGMQRTAEGVGEFYSALREGRPIGAAAEQLREMGVLSDIAVNELVALQQSGAASAEVFASLTRRLEANRGAMHGLAGDVAQVNAAYEAAKKTLQEKFGSPFVASDVENTRNMTAAMEAIAPAVGRVAGFLEKLINGFSTVWTWMAKTAAQSPLLMVVLENTVVVLSSLVAVASALAAVSLASWLMGVSAWMMKLTFDATLATIAVRGLGLAVAATGIGLLVAMIGTAVGIYMNFAQAAEQTARALLDQKKAHDQVAEAMDKQIKAAVTLREHQEALTKAVQNTKDAQAELAKALQEQADASVDRTGIRGSIARVKGWFGSDDMGFVSDDAANQKVAEAKRNLFAAKAREKAQRDRVAEMAKRGILSPDRAQANIDVARAKALVGGNQEEVVRLGNLGNFGQNFDQLRAMFGDEGARSRALALTAGQIAERAAAPAASSLARIGLGGEAGGGTDVQKQIRDLNRDAVRYLQAIDAKLAGGGGGGNVPQEYDGT